jgi:hypothetical protein
MGLVETRLEVEMRSRAAYLHVSYVALLFVMFDCASAHMRCIAPIPQPSFVDCLVDGDDPSFSLCSFVLLANIWWENVCEEGWA